MSGVWSTRFRSWCPCRCTMQLRVWPRTGVCWRDVHLVGAAVVQPVAAQQVVVVAVAAVAAEVVVVAEVAAEVVVVAEVDAEEAAAEEEVVGVADNRSVVCCCTAHSTDHTQLGARFF